MLNRGCSRMRTLNQTVPSKEDDVLFTFYYTVLLKDFNSHLRCRVVMLLMTRYFF